MLARMFRRRPSAAIVIACLALLVALGGTAGADPIGEISRLISGSQIKKNSIRGNRLVRDTITGREINERRIGTVPRAARAQSALNADLVGAMAVRRLFFRAAPGAPPVQVFSGAGLTLFASCSAAGKPVLRATTAVNGSTITVLRTGTTSGAAQTAGTKAFNVGASITVLGASDNGAGTLAYARPDGAVATVSLGYADSPSAGGAFCTIAGTAVHS